MKSEHLYFTVATANYLQSSLATINTLTNNGINNKEICLFIPDIGENELTKLKLKYNLPNANFYITYDDCDEEIQNLLQDVSKYYNNAEIGMLSKFIGLKVINAKYNPTKIIFFDSDLFFTSNIKLLVSNLNKRDFYVTPHCLTASNLENEFEFLNSGWINSGFFIANTKFGKFNVIVNWLIERCSSAGFMFPYLGMYNDQTWLNGMATLYNQNVDYINDPGINVAYWNLHERDISEKNNQFFVNNNNKLYFFHFSSHNNFDNELLSAHTEIKLSDNIAIKKIASSYKFYLNQYSYLNNIEDLNLKFKGDNKNHVKNRIIKQNSYVIRKYHKTLIEKVVAKIKSYIKR